MNPERKCPHCGSPLVDGLCPKCLVRVSLEAPEAEDAADPTDETEVLEFGDPVPTVPAAVVVTEQSGDCVARVDAPDGRIAGRNGHLSGAI